MKKKALALLVNDLHITQDNIVEFNKNWGEAVDICVKNEINDIVIGGDVFTARASQTLPVLLAVKNAFMFATTKGLNLTIAYGNHDCPNSKAILSYCHLYDTMDGVEVIDTFDRINWNSDIQLCVISYFP